MMVSQTIPQLRSSWQQVKLKTCCKNRVEVARIQNNNSCAPNAFLQPTSLRGERISTHTLSIFAASAPTMSPYFVAWPASSSGMSFHETLGVSGLQYAGRHLEIPTHEQLNSPTTHFCSLTSTFSQHFPKEALIMSAVHQRGIGSSGSSRVFIMTGQSCSTNFLRSASRSILIVFFV